jgi:hypothetical protein
MQVITFFVLLLTLLVQPQTPPVYVTAGIGVDGVAVGYSTRNTVTARYGDGYQLVEHNKYSYEMKYEVIGMSFWYRFEDPQQKIFAISVWPKSRGFTAGGIVVGRSTLKDVFDEYGKAEFGTTTSEKSWYVEYPGISFHVEYKPRDKEHWTPEELLKRKIVEIEIVAMEKG